VESNPLKNSASSPGSATFITTDKPQTLKLLVSTTGLMIRKDSTGRLPHEP
jgi:hypothetical protein